MQYFSRALVDNIMRKFSVTNIQNKIQNKPDHLEKLKKSMIFYLLIAFLMTVPFVASAADKKTADKKTKDVAASDKKIKNTGAQKKGDFYSVIILAADSKAFIKQLSKSIKSGKAALPVSSEKIKKGKEAAVFVYFSGCKANKTSKCLSSISFKITGPKGKIYATTQNLVLWNGKAVKKGNLQKSTAQLDLVFDPKDSIGKYKIEAIVVDNVAKKTLKLTRVFSVTK